MQRAALSTRLKGQGSGAQRAVRLCGRLCSLLNQLHVSCPLWQVEQCHPQIHAPPESQNRTVLGNGVFVDGIKDNYDITLN